MERPLDQSRLIRVADAPTVSVLITSRGELARLESALDALEPSCREREWQLVVVRAGQSGAGSELRQRYPAIRFFDAPEATAVADMRELGMTAADGDIVILGEDHQVTPEWIASSVFSSEHNATTEI